MMSKSVSSALLIGGAHAYWFRVNEYGNPVQPAPSSFKSRINIYKKSQSQRPAFFQLAQAFVCNTTRGNFEIVENENYRKFLHHVQHRDSRTALITVSNHRSVFDDPGLLSCLLPLPIALISRNIRWNICAEEVCFQNNALLESFFTAGKTIPIFRGGGVNQQHLLDYARQAADGEWLHIFPEGAVTQLSELGGRMSYQRDALGCLKWGVAKLIAHAPVKPIMVPYFHTGMDGVMPMDHDRKLLTNFPQLNQSISVVFGEELKFDDLIEEHERNYGPLWKYSTASNVKFSGSGAEKGRWISEPSDFLLYNKITDRIELALNELNNVPLR